MFFMNKFFVRKIHLLLIVFIQTIACQNNNVSGQESGSSGISSGFHIQRFDKELYEWLNTNDSALPLKMKQDYRNFLHLYINYVLNITPNDSISLDKQIRNYFSESDYAILYRDAEIHYNSIEDIEQSLGKAFADLQFYFPEKKLPIIYMHVSGLNQSVVVGEGILSVSIDKYLGKDYSLYEKYYPNYLKKNMIRDRIVSDYLTAWCFSEFELKNESNLLDQIIYRGKIIYLLQNLLPDVSEHILLGFTENEFNLCMNNEKSIWRFILENKHLYINDYLIISKYINEAPYSAFFTNEYPAQIGVFIGWRIVSKYMEKNGKITLSDLMNNTNSQQILSKSKYK